MPPSGIPPDRGPGIIAAASGREGRRTSGIQKPSKKPRLTFPVTTLAGKAWRPKRTTLPKKKPKVEEAVTEQQDLLAEFEKIADELNRVLANLEGSTLLNG